MKKSLAVAAWVLVGYVFAGYSFAAEMPAGSGQARLTAVLAEYSAMVAYEPCPPTRNEPDAQVICANYSGSNPLGFMQRLDEVLYTFSVYPDTLPEIQDLELTPNTDYWIYLPEFRRFERSFELGEGSYRIIYVPYESLSSTITIIYTPQNLQS